MDSYMLHYQDAKQAQELRFENAPSHPLNNGTNQSDYVKALEKEVMDLLKQKQKVDKKIIDIEYNIYQLEGKYFEETLTTGNILKGFDGYQGIRTDRKRPKAFLPEDRIFSLSSSTYQQSLEAKKLELESTSCETSTSTTSTFTTSQQSLKKRKYSPSSSTSTSTVSSTSMNFKKKKQGHKRNTRVAALAEETRIT
ncbi:Chromatin modification- protein meaf6 [Coelomomyces lativittatus]|nr:Chromatin modification- protein meaf6 [Coelomomyces lativittatus]